MSVCTEIYGKAAALQSRHRGTLVVNEQVGLFPACEAGLRDLMSVPLRDPCGARGRLGGVAELEDSSRECPPVASMRLEL